MTITAELWQCVPLIMDDGAHEPTSPAGAAEQRRNIEDLQPLESW